jgi:thioredoxin 1
MQLIYPILILTSLNGFWFFGKEKPKSPPIELPPVVILQKGDFTPQVIEIKDTLVYLQIGAPWCKWCKKLEPIIEEIAKSDKYIGKIKFTRLNAELDMDVARALKVGPVPDSRVFLNGKQVSKLVGFWLQEDIEKFLDELLKKLNDSLDKKELDKPTII